MQKIFNLMAVLSFVGTAGIIGGGYYLYTQKDPIIGGMKEKIITAATEAIAEALPGMLDDSMPELPSVTGGAIPAVPSTTGGVIPPGSGLPLPTNLEFFKTK